jgi:hypothetical protein
MWYFNINVVFIDGICDHFIHIRAFLMGKSRLCLSSRMPSRNVDLDTGFAYNDPGHMYPARETLPLDESGEVSRAG